MGGNLLKKNKKMRNEKNIYAVYNDETIRVYQAYSSAIAEPAVTAQRFVAPFKMERMTWIKPSFLWMMYRAGYGHKDHGQKHILAIDITHEGFRWALENSCGSHIPEGMSREDWDALKARMPVRIQWDPERDIHHTALDHRSIQIGLKGEAVQRYVNDWIVRIEDITKVAHEMYGLIQAGEDDGARAYVPEERLYTMIDDHGQYG